MLIRDDSPLRSLPVTLDRRHVLNLDAFRISVQMAEVAAERLVTSLVAASQNDISPEAVRGIVPMATLDAWVIVDCIHRLRELMGHMPGLKQKDPVVQLFFRKTANVEQMRHFVQHMKGEVQTVANLALPVWGVLTWRTADKDSTQFAHMLVPGTLYPDSVNPGPVFGATRDAPVSDVTLRTAAGAVRVLDLLKAVEPMIALFETSIDRQFGGVPRSGADMVVNLFCGPATRDAPSD